MRPLLTRTARFVFAGAFLFPSTTVLGQATPLRVLRVAPRLDTGAGPMEVINVTFDRPVAGSLDRSIDPATVFRIEPGVRGSSSGAIR